LGEQRAVGALTLIPAKTSPWEIEQRCANQDGTFDRFLGVDRISVPPDARAPLYPAYYIRYVTL